jgi:formylglycine-generating enzyme required for sulfatase activity
MPFTARLDAALALPVGARLGPLCALGRELLAASPDAAPPATRAGLVDGLVHLLVNCIGSARERLELGEVLGLLGDPRLRSPADDDYWATVTLEDGSRLQVGRFPVTTAEFTGWIAAGGYDAAASWSAGGQAWRASGAPPWAALAQDPQAAVLTVPNQPVAGPTWWEAEAYARAHGARLPSRDERLDIVRGQEKRPYPWGSPFGDGNANTREEGLNRPCAVGLYRFDRTPEGICDLAGNMAEWLADEAGDRRMLHPGSWARPSMAAWSKAIELAPAGERSADASFRLVRAV